MIGSAQRMWLSNAIRCIEADFNRSADTHVIRVQLPRRTGVTLYLKDESSHPSGGSVAISRRAIDAMKHPAEDGLFYARFAANMCGVDNDAFGTDRITTAIYARRVDAFVR